MCASPSNFTSPIRPFLNYNDKKKEDPEDLGRITINHKLVEGKKVVSGNVLRFLGKPLPQRLVTFNSIEINFLNAEIIQWFQNWQPIFESCPLNLSISGLSDQIWRLIERDMFFLFSKNIENMDLSDNIIRICPTILSQCAILRTVNYTLNSLVYDPSSWQPVQDWLMSPRADNGTPLRIVNLMSASEPVILRCIEELKTAFGLATSRASFIVVIYAQHRLSPFSIDNKRTGEELTLIRHDRVFNNFKLVRHGSPNFLPKATLDGAVEWLMEEEMHRIVVKLRDDDVGDGLLDSFPSAGPSDRR
ncbi:hypothetical protein niasHT_038751 [Heterodera trifolii]|uniref:Uncharacterized protein n=1 Tax=Heterodera trifolii TaxID=157864 RepID=A0ABD2IYF1_9BILA